ncbi:hypothetical protein ACP70R_031270 [Stipagrostis hirtigluma subsp. patula]
MCDKSQLYNHGGEPAPLIEQDSSMKQTEAGKRCCEEKPGKSPTSWAERHLNVGLVVGVLLVLLTYLVVSQQYGIRVPYVVISESQRIPDKQRLKAPGETDVPTENGKVVCSTEEPSDTCEVDGDVRINGTAMSVVIVPTSRAGRREWKLRPYSRKEFTSIKEFTVTQLQDPAAAPACTVTHSVPAVLFALGGSTGNYWHDFTDVLVPLFVASRRYGGEVQFLITGVQPWWLNVYRTIVQGLSRYDAVDMDADTQVRCFRHVTVGIRIYKVFDIVPELAPGGPLTMADFTRFLRDAYALPRGAPVSLAREPEKKPRLLLINRAGTRRFMNAQEIARAAEAAGFEAVVLELLREERSVEEQAREVNSFDVMLGVHGAGLTNSLFLPAGGVLIQVVPYGKMEFISRLEFGEPAANMGLKYLDYSVAAEESSLLERLGPDHPAILDPLSVHNSGWDKVSEFYLKQDVRINVTRFAPTLTQALEHLRQQ